MKDLIRKILREDFDWVEEIPSLPLEKEDHWFIFVDSLEEQREAEDYIHSRGYTIYGPEHEDYCFYKDEDLNPLSALEHDPEEGRTLNNLYDGRYLTYEQAKEEYPNAKIYVWSKVNSVVNEDLDWVSNVGRDREQIMDDLETRIKTMDWDVDLERDHEWTTDEEGYFFGRFWCGEGLYELYEYGDTYTIRMYSREMYGGHHRYEHFNSIQDLSSKELMREVTRIIVNCLN